MNAHTDHRSATRISDDDLTKYLTKRGDAAPDIWTSTLLAGPSGSGKTFSAMLIARGLGEGKGFGFIDTENRRGLHYRNYFPEMDHLDMAAFVDAHNGGRHEPEIYIEAINLMQARGYSVIVIDSFSHAHEGIGGVLEIQNEELNRIAGDDPAKRDKMNFSAWAAVKPRQRALAATIAGCKAHVILCARAKKSIQRRDGSLLHGNNIKREDIPFSIAADKDLIFEMTLAGVLRPESDMKGRLFLPALKLGDDLVHAIDVTRPLSSRTGELMLEWSRGQGEARKITAFYNEARDNARQGLEHMKGWHAALSDDKKGLLRPLSDELRSLAQRADQDAAAADSIFDQLAPETSLDPDEVAHHADQAGDLAAFAAEMRQKAEAEKSDAPAGLN